MVIYDLACSEGHHFEGWFQDLQSCQLQAAEGQLACPVCGNTQVSKMVTGSAIKRTAEDRAGATLPVAPQAAVAPLDPPAAPSAPPSPEQVRAFLGTLSAVIRANSDDVGPRFAAEARKIHAGDAPERMIRGTTTLEEENQLVEDEIPFMKVPLISTDD